MKNNFRDEFFLHRSYISMYADIVTLKKGIYLNDITDNTKLSDSEH